MSVKLSVIIPCFNEENNLKRGVLLDVERYLKKQSYDWEVLICDDGSSDKSREMVKDFVANKLRFRLLVLKHGGKPSAIYEGIKSAKGEILLLTDMDQSTPISELGKLLPCFGDNYDVVIGSRGLHRKNFSIIRKVASIVFRYLRGVFILPNVIDTQCGFKTIRADLAKAIFPKLSYFQNSKDHGGWSVSAYDAEMLFIADKWGYKIKEIPVKWKDEDKSNTKNRSLSGFVDQSIQMAEEVISVIDNNRRGKYDKDELI